VIYLLDQGAAVDEVVSSEQMTPLSFAVSIRDIDMIRILLGRGASLDRFDNNGHDAWLYCAIPDVAGLGKVAAADMLKVLNEYTSLDTKATYTLGGVTLLHSMAPHQSASEVDFLISLGSNVENRDRYGRSALFYAAWVGNPATYFALLAHGSKTAYLENNLLFVIAERAHLANAGPNYGPRIYDPIIKDLLSRRADLMTSIYVVNALPVNMQGPAIPLQQAAAEYGPETEAWFLGLLQECGLETEEDRRRLQELRMAVYDQHGTVIGEVDEDSDTDSGDEDPEYAGSVSGQSSAQSEADDTEEEYFWDASEGA
jgi:hypothetical protein